MRSIRLNAMRFFLLLFLLLSAGVPAGTEAASEFVLSQGETVYVPVYGNIFSAPKAIPFSLATILSIRNTDLEHPLRVTAADFYDTGGRLLKRFYTAPVTLAPLESVHVYIPEKESSGGTGANFIVRWRAAQPINAPIIECVMFGTRSGQGISFVSPGRVIRDSGSP